MQFGNLISAFWLFGLFPLAHHNPSHVTYQGRDFVNETKGGDLGAGEAPLLPLIDQSARGALRGQQ